MLDAAGRLVRPWRTAARSLVYGHVVIDDRFQSTALAYAAEGLCVLESACLCNMLCDGAAAADNHDDVVESALTRAIVGATQTFFRKVINLNGTLSS